jgi:uncharacterized protein with HEPN domain
MILLTTWSSRTACCIASRWLGKRHGGFQTPALASIPDVSWPDVVSMRNRVIHQYDDIDLSIVWRTVTVSIPNLISRIRAAVGDNPEG